MRTALQEPTNAPRIWFDIVSATPKYSEGKIIYSTADVDKVQWVQNPKATLEVNVAGSLSFTISPDSELYDEIGVDQQWSRVYIVRHSSVSQWELLYGTIIWRGRLYDITIDSNNNKVVIYEGQLAELNDVIHPAFKWNPGSDPTDDPDYYETDEADRKPYEDDVVYGDERTFSGLLNRLINYYNMSATRDIANPYIEIEISDNHPNDIPYCNDIDRIYNSEAMEDVIFHTFDVQENGIFDIINELMIDPFGGGMLLYYVYDDATDTVTTHLRYINLSSGTPIRSMEFGKDITSIEKTSEMDDFSTIAIPYGKQLTDVDKSWVYMRSIEDDSNHWLLFDVESDASVLNPSNDLVIDVSNNTFVVEDNEGHTILSGGSLSGTQKNYLSDFTTRIGYNEGRKGYYISPEGGKNAPIPTDVSGLYPDRYVVFPQIRVRPGERYFVTHFINNNSFIHGKIPSGFLPYAIFDSKWVMISSGPAIGETKVMNSEGEEITEYEPYYAKNYEITIPEEGKYMKIAAYRPWYKFTTDLDKYPQRRPFILKKYNPKYKLENQTVLRTSGFVDTSDGMRIQKKGTPVGLISSNGDIRDTNPFFTDNYVNWVELMRYRKIHRVDLEETYGAIEKTIEFGDSAFNRTRLKDMCVNQIKKFSPSYRVEVEGVDTSLIDTTGHMQALNIADRVQIISKPHGFTAAMGFALPIKKIELDLQDAGNIRIFASNRDDDTLSTYLKNNKS